ncbi:hypothetical protein M422DRAFT_265969 [Sphaerobolus stellatus SS14]|uniref:Uncharacterized protein n=1 Tax=Sphaerobolus stellatus (strain SS14) TaxID=990650 RepID=A0A0C9UCA4_SPHS4|nr:hypothetical protein M422DRAFT_265969 [Sphaerobolus stellatus SS14]
MPGGRPRKYFTEEEERQGRLQAKKAYRERNIDEERHKFCIRTKHATIKAERAARKVAKKAARKDEKRRKMITQMTQIPCGSVGASNEQSGSIKIIEPPEFNFKTNLDQIMGDLLYQMFNKATILSAEETKTFYQQRYLKWIADYKEKSLGIVRTEVRKYVQAGEACGVTADLVKKEALHRTYFKDGKNLAKARRDYEGMKAAASCIHLISNADEEFILTVEGLSMQEYQRAYDHNELVWQFRGF